MGRNLWLGAAALMVAAGAQAADELPKAETILDKYVEVTGGKAAYAKIHSEVQTGSMTFVAMGLKGQLTAYSAEPNKHLVEITLEGIGKIQEGSNGEVAWTNSAVQGPRIKEGEEKSHALEEARLNAEAQWREIYKSAETAGLEAIDGKDCYKVVLTPKNGKPVTKWYDKQSNLIVKVSLSMKTPMGEIESESLLSDYRKEGDILLPHKTATSAMGQQFTMTVDTVQYNAEIPKEKFDLPAEIQALLKKAQ